MRFSLRCNKCDEVIQLWWKACPGCGRSVEGCHNTTVDRLRESIRQDMAAFYKEDALFRGTNFISNAAKDCLFDWDWAVEMGWPEGLWLVARCFKQGLDEIRDRIPKSHRDFEEACDEIAADLLRRAAAQGFAPAENDFGYFLLQERGGLQKNAEQAFCYVQKSAGSGYLHAKYNLSSLYRCGHGVPKDETKSLQIHFEVAEQGFAPAQASLGRYYRLGSNGLPKDYLKALAWYQKAADQGEAQGMFGVGCAYYNGEGVGKDKSIAKHWLTKAAKNGAADAQAVIQVEERKFFPWKF
jgi:TPR repeat protein